MKEFEKELAALINKHSLEQRSNTPDFILASYLVESLNAFDCFSEDQASQDLAYPDQASNNLGSTMRELFEKTTNRRNSWYA